MRRKSLGQRSRLLLFLRLNLFKKTDEGLGIVSRFIHVLQPEVVCFRLETALELHEGERQSQARRLVHGISNPSTYENKRDGADVGPVGARHLAHSMSRRNVRDLMGHYASQFPLFVAGKIQPRVNK